MEDKEVKDKTVPVEAPEKQKDLKKPSGKSVTGKPLDGIDINPQLKDVSTDGNQLKIRKEDSVDLTTPVIQERKALTLPQRQKRARNIRSHERSMERAREIAKKKLAPTSKLEQRAVAHARAIVKKRFAARKGTPYAELTTSEKIQVDTAVAKKTKLIQKIATRLLPRIRKAEYERLKSFRAGAPLQDLSTQNPKAQGIMPAVKEEMSELFNSLNTQDTAALINIIENTIDQFKQNNDPIAEQLQKMLNAVLPEDVITESLIKKSDKTGISFSTLKEVFDRGEYSWDASNRMTQEQFAFARVNSYIAKGKAWHMDADLREDKVVNAELDESFASFLEAKMKNPCWKGYEMVGTKKKGGKTVPNCVPNVKESDDHDRYGRRNIIGAGKKSHADAMKDVAPMLDAIAKKNAAKNAAKKQQSEETEIAEVDISKFNIPMARAKAKKTPTRTFMSVIDEIGIPVKHHDRARSVWFRTKDVEAVKKFVSSVKEETEIDEVKATPYVKPYHENGKQVGWKSSNGHHVKYWQLSDSAKKKAHLHAGLEEETTATKTRKKIELVDRPPADQAVKARQQEIQKKIIDESTSLDESFNMAWTSGIGVTLSAADCGIKIKGGFSLHPDVIEQMDAIEEDVVAADKKPVYMPPRRHKDGSYGKASTAMRKTGKKIIDVKEPEDVDSDEHDGK
jgi:hypothetical protein